MRTNLTLPKARTKLTKRLDPSTKMDQEVSRIDGFNLTLTLAKSLITSLFIYYPVSTPLTANDILHIHPSPLIWTMYILISGYRLIAFISHMGTSTMCGHYVCHVLKEGRYLFVLSIRRTTPRAATINQLIPPCDWLSEHCPLGITRCVLRENSNLFQ